MIFPEVKLVYVKWREENRIRREAKIYLSTNNILKTKLAF